MAKNNTPSKIRVSNVLAGSGNLKKKSFLGLYTFVVLKYKTLFPHRRTQLDLWDEMVDEKYERTILVNAFIGCLEHEVSQTN